MKIDISTSFLATAEKQTIHIKVNGEEAGVRYLSGPIIRRLNAYALIRCDLTFGKSLLEILKSFPDVRSMDEQRRALFYAAVMSYTKCFTETKGRGVKLEVDQLRKLRESSVGQHSTIMGFRNQFIAHGGDNESYEQSKFVVLLGRHKSSPKYFGTACFPLQMVGVDTEDVKSLTGLVELALAVEHEKTSALWARVNDSVGNVDLDRLYDTSQEIQLGAGLSILKG